MNPDAIFYSYRLCCGFFFQFFGFGWVQARGVISVKLFGSANFGFLSTFFPAANDFQFSVGSAFQPISCLFVGLFRCR